MQIFFFRLRIGNPQDTFHGCAVVRATNEKQAWSFLAKRQLKGVEAVKNDYEFKFAVPGEGGPCGIIAFIDRTGHVGTL